MSKKSRSGKADEVRDCVGEPIGLGVIESEGRPLNDILAERPDLMEALRTHCLDHGAIKAEFAAKGVHVQLTDDKGRCLRVRRWERLTRKGVGDIFFREEE